MSERHFNTAFGQSDCARYSFPPILPVRQLVYPSRHGTFFNPDSVPDAKNEIRLNSGLVNKSYEISSEGITLNSVNTRVSEPMSSTFTL